MIIKDADFEQLKEELITLYNVGRNYGDIYVMEECDYLLQKLQTIENDYLRRKNALRESIK